MRTWGGSESALEDRSEHQSTNALFYCPPTPLSIDPTIRPEDVVDLYHGGSGDVRQTLKQCREAMEQVVANEHAASAAGSWAMYTSPDHDNRPYWHNAQRNETVSRGRMA